MAKKSYAIMSPATRSTVAICVLSVALRAVAAAPHIDALGAVTILTDNDLRGKRHTSENKHGLLTGIGHSQPNIAHYQRAPTPAINV